MRKLIEILLGICTTIIVGLLAWWSFSPYAPTPLFYARCFVSLGTPVQTPDRFPIASILQCHSPKTLPDAGKACDDDSQCTGVCVPGIGETDGPVYPGLCSDTVKFVNYRAF